MGVAQPSSTFLRFQQKKMHPESMYLCRKGHDKWQSVHQICTNMHKYANIPDICRSQAPTVPPYVLPFPFERRGSCGVAWGAVARKVVVNKAAVHIATQKEYIQHIVSTICIYRVY